MSYALLRAILAEQARRKAARDRELLAEQERVKAARAVTTQWLTPIQKQVHACDERTVALLAGRAGGKSSVAVAKAVSVVQKHPRPWILLSSLTREQARRTLYRPFQMMSESVGMKLPDPDQQGRIKLADGGIIYLTGVDSLRDIRRYRGTPWDFAFVDEAGAVADHYLYELLYNVVEPRLMDKPHSKLWVGGTPGAVLSGTWFDICGPPGEGGSSQPGWSVFRWSALDNPHVDAEGYFEEVLERRGWDREHPTFVREYMGQWVTDETRVIAHVAESQMIDEVPDGEYQRLLALDFGVVDDCAGVHLWLPKDEPVIYVIRAWQQAGLSPSEASTLIAKDVADHGIDRITGDSGGIGKAFVAEYARRHQLQIQPVPKSEKATHLRLFADDLPAFRFVRDGPGIPGLVRELRTVVWDEKRQDVQDGLQDHRFHAAYYGWRTLSSALQAARQRAKRPVRREPADFVSHLGRLRDRQKAQAGRPKLKGDDWSID